MLLFLGAAFVIARPGKRSEVTKARHPRSNQLCRPTMPYPPSSPEPDSCIMAWPFFCPLGRH